MTTINFESAIESIKNANDKQTIESITLDILEKMNFRLNECGKNKGMQISEKTFINDKTKFIDLIKSSITSFDDNFCSEYNGYKNHHAVSLCYQYKYKKLDVNNQNNLEVDVIAIPKKAVTLDAKKIIDLAISWLDSDDIYLIGIGVAVLTGRRQSEIYFYSQFKADDDRTMIVSHLAKKRGENYNSQYRIPVLVSSDLIELAIEKIRKNLPMSELLEIVNNSKDIGLGLKLAREKFNNNYSSQILKVYNSHARQYFKDCMDDKLSNDKDNFHGMRAFYASIFYNLILEKYQCSVNDAIIYLKSALAHDTEGIAQKYSQFNFKNLPTTNDFDDSIFSIENISDVPLEIKEDRIVQVNLTRLLGKLDINSQLELTKKLNEGSDIESILASFINIATKARMVSQAVGNSKIKPDARDKIGNIVLSMIEYNHSQQQNENPCYIAINATSIDSASKYITGKQIDKVTLKNAVDNLSDKINDCHNSLKLDKILPSRKNADGGIDIANYHLRGEKNRDKVELIYRTIKTIYEQRYKL